MQIQIPLLKADAERRLVIGRAAIEQPDRSGEILDYASAREAFASWSKSFEEATNGLSKGNVRAQHNPKLVAGKVVEISFNDEEKAIDIIAKIVDDNEWRKVCEGVYTGFSVGGSYEKKWKDQSGLTRYTPRVAEVSLVDRPCIPDAKILEIVKADGSVEQIRLVGRPRTYAELAKAAPRTFAEITRPRTFAEI